MSEQNPWIAGVLKSLSALWAAEGNLREALELKIDSAL